MNEFGDLDFLGVYEQEPEQTRARIQNDMYRRSFKRRRFKPSYLKRYNSSDLTLAENSDLVANACSQIMYLPDLRKGLSGKGQSRSILPEALDKEVALSVRVPNQEQEGAIRSKGQISKGKDSSSENIRSDNSSSFKTFDPKNCGLDALTIGSLISSSGFATRLSRKQTLEITKKNIFGEFIYEIEGLSHYFNFNTENPTEEVLLDEKEVKFSKGIHSILLTFCIDVRPIPHPKLGFNFKKRVITSRCLLILNMGFREAQSALRKEAVEPNSLSSWTKTKLKDSGDFDHPLDAVVEYSYPTIEGNIDHFTTIRIASQKSYQNTSKTVAYVYERSCNLHEFSQQTNDPLPELSTQFKKSKSNNNIGPPSTHKQSPKKTNKFTSKRQKSFMLKKISKLERVSQRYTKASIYSEMAWPEDLPLESLRKKTICLMTSNFINKSSIL